MRGSLGVCAITQSRAMMGLFAGYAGAHGTHGATEARVGGPKLEIKKTARTVRDPVTDALWQQHLAGERALGIITIREDSTCMWGAVDVDQYDIVHKDLVELLAARKIPGIVGRTKSGGAHIYMFFSEPVPAGEVLSRLRELASAIGAGDSEVFPKQDHILADRGDLGNWLNMPYFGGDKTERYAVRADGRGMSLGQFISEATSSRITREQFGALLFHEPVLEFRDGPPCLETLASAGVREGGRNNALFAFGVLAKKMRPTGWQALLEEWNRSMFQPPLQSSEVMAVVKGLEKKAYNYRCKDQPIVSHCNMSLCRTRLYGIGMASGGAKIVESVSVLDTSPPLFFVNLKTGGTIECNSKTLLNPRDFQHAVLEQLRQVIALYPLDEWLSQVQTCVENATVIEAPREVSLTGQFEELLERFCTDRHVAETREDVLLGKPFLDEDEGLVWFRLRDLQDLLDRHRFRELTRGQITTRIKSMGGRSEFWNLRGKGANVWCVPQNTLQWVTERGPTPRGEESAI